MTYMPHPTTSHAANRCRNRVRDFIALLLTIGCLFPFAEPGGAVDPETPTQVTVDPPAVVTDVNQPVTFSAVVTGEPAIAYQWLRDGILLPDAMSATLALANVTTNDASTNYVVLVTTATGTVTSAPAPLTVNQLAQTITFGALAARTVGDPSFTLGASASSALPVAYTSSDPGVASVAGSTVTLVGRGTTTITASQAGDATFLPATAVVQNLVVTPVVATPPVITSSLTAVGAVGQPFAYTILASHTPTSFSATGLPAGVTGNPATGQITGTPTEGGAFTVIIAAANADGVDSQALELQINTGPQRPVITRAPVNQTVLPGTTVIFTVAATGSGPLNYQWKKDGAAITGATGTSYTVPGAQMTNNGAYTVVVKDAHGQDERTAFLTVVTRQLKLGDVQVVGAAVGSAVHVPLTLVGDGTEQTVALSFGFDPAVVTFTAVMGEPVGATVTVSNLIGGNLIGVTVELPTGQTFPAGFSEVARLLFATASAAQVASTLVQGDTPVGRQLLTAAAASLPTEFANGSVTLRTPGSLVLSDFTGLLTETVAISTPPGGDEGGFLRVLVYDLGVDGLGHVIRLQNATGTTPAGIPYVLVPAPAPGTAVNVVLEYYVSDRRTVPPRRLVIETTPTGPPAVAGVAMALEPQGLRGFVNGLDGGFYLNFRTEAGRTYYVQYRDHATDAWRTSFPAVPGLGVPGVGSYQQWIDTGPPRTTSPPAAATTRFYRVLQVP